MGLVNAKIKLTNPGRPDLQPMETTALVDTGAVMLCLPQHISIQLGLKELEKREATVASGESLLCPYVGPVQITFGNRNCFTGALVLGDQVLLGAIPLEDMDLIVNPRARSLSVNPKNPNIPSVLIK